MLKSFQYFYRIDWLLFVTVLLLSFWGLAVIYSISLGQGAIIDGNIWSSAVLRKQIISLIVGVILFFVFSFVNYRVFYIYSRYLLSGVVLLLIAVLFLGGDIRGTKSWFEIFGFNFQPVEVAKLALIIILAKYFTINAKYVSQFRHLLFTGFLTLTIVGLVLLQPDFGSSMILIAIWLGIIFTVGTPKKYLFFIGTLAVIAIIFGWIFFLKPYQKDRIKVFIDPESDAKGSGYNVTQSIIAIGSGQLFGKGLGYGSQSQLRFLPESHTDFIFAVIAEEMGFFSLLFFLSLFAFFYYRLYLISQNSIDDFGFLFCIGVIIYVFSQMFINVAMNMGLMPVTGLPLPFVSFGGSSLVMNMVMLGIIQNINIKSHMQGLK